MIHSAFILVALFSISTFAQDPQNHPCISPQRTEQIYEEYRTKYTEARLGQSSLELLRAFYREADSKIVEKINQRKALTAPEAKSFRISAIRAIKSVAPANVTCDEETGICRENIRGNSKIFKIKYSEVDDIISISTKAEIFIPVEQRLFNVSDTFHPSFDAVSSISLRDGRIESTDDFVDVVHPYNLNVELPPQELFWKPLDHRMLKGMLKNDVAYCAHRERRLSEEATSVDNSERGNVEEIAPAPSQKQSSGTSVQDQ